MFALNNRKFPLLCISFRYLNDGTLMVFTLMDWFQCTDVSLVRYRSAVDITGLITSHRFIRLSLLGKCRISFSLVLSIYNGAWSEGLSYQTTEDDLG